MTSTPPIHPISHIGHIIFPAHTAIRMSAMVATPAMTSSAVKAILDIIPAAVKLSHPLNALPARG
jgi:hypothetical protein